MEFSRTTDEACIGSGFQLIKFKLGKLVKFYKLSIWIHLDAYSISNVPVNLITWGSVT